MSELSRLRLLDLYPFRHTILFRISYSQVGQRHWLGTPVLREPTYYCFSLPFYIYICISRCIYFPGLVSDNIYQIGFSNRSCLMFHWYISRVMSFKYTRTPVILPTSASLACDHIYCRDNLALVKAQTQISRTILVVSPRIWGNSHMPSLGE